MVVGQGRPPERVVWAHVVRIQSQGTRSQDWRQLGTDGHWHG
jgi:hypothetical protein